MHMFKWIFAMPTIIYIYIYLIPNRTIHSISPLPSTSIRETLPLPSALIIGIDDVGNRRARLVMYVDDDEMRNGSNACMACGRVGRV